MPADRVPPSEEAAELLALTREIVAAELAPRAAEAEENSAFPRDVFRLLGRSGLLALPYPESCGGGGPPPREHLPLPPDGPLARAPHGAGESRPAPPPP